MTMKALAFEHDLDWLLRQNGSSVCAQSVRPVDNFFTLAFGLSSRCNYRCPHCYYRGGGSTPARDLPPETLANVFSNMPRLQSIIFGLEGEPLLYPHIFGALGLAATKTDFLLLVTNGSRLGRNVCERLKDFPVRGLVISMDAAVKSAYERFRPGGDFAQVLANCENACRELGSAISWHAVLFKENLPYLPRLPELASDVGVRCISLQQMRESEAILRRGLHAAQTDELLRTIAAIADSARAKKVAVSVDPYFAPARIMREIGRIAMEYPSLSIASGKTGTCEMPNSFASILSDGSLFPCCGNFRPAKIAEYTFDGVFNHPYLASLRQITAQGRILAPCRKCRQL